MYNLQATVSQMTPLEAASFGFPSQLCDPLMDMVFRWQFKTYQEARSFAKGLIREGFSSMDVDPELDGEAFIQPMRLSNVLIRKGSND